MPHPAPAPAPDLVTLAPGVALARGRAHEIAGPSRQAMALMIASRTAGSVVWLGPWSADGQLMGDGIAAFLDPGRLIFGRARTATDVLWAAEEALRSGAAPLVVAETSVVPALTPVRRLHLAAEAGAAVGSAPLMLLLTPGAGGAQGVETRWRADPAPGWALDQRPRWRLMRLRARGAPPAEWEMRLTATGVVLEPSPDPGRTTAEARRPHAGK